MKISWENAIRSFATAREHYMRNFDSPEKRSRDKNPQRFSLVYADATEAIRTKLLIELVE